VSEKKIYLRLIGHDVFDSSPRKFKIISTQRLYNIAAIRFFFC